jgi:hypothetical protein
MGPPTGDCTWEFNKHHMKSKIEMRRKLSTALEKQPGKTLRQDHSRHT